VHQKLVEVEMDLYRGGRAEAGKRFFQHADWISRQSIELYCI